VLRRGYSYHPIQTSCPIDLFDTQSLFMFQARPRTAHQLFSVVQGNTFFLLEGVPRSTNFPSRIPYLGVRKSRTWVTRVLNIKIHSKSSQCCFESPGYCTDLSLVQSSPIYFTNLLKRNLIQAINDSRILNGKIFCTLRGQSHFSTDTAPASTPLSGDQP
jgi:hypothetical protein